MNNRLEECGMLPAYIKIHDAIKKTLIWASGQLVVACQVNDI